MNSLYLCKKREQNREKMMNNLQLHQVRNVKPIIQHLYNPLARQKSWLPSFKNPTNNINKHLLNVEFALKKCRLYYQPYKPKQSRIKSHKCTKQAVITNKKGLWKRARPYKDGDKAHFGRARPQLKILVWKSQCEFLIRFTCDWPHY